MHHASFRKQHGAFPASGTAAQKLPVENFSMGFDQDSGVRHFFFIVPRIFLRLSIS